MKWSLYIGKPAGIKVFIHWTFILRHLALLDAPATGAWTF